MSRGGQGVANRPYVPKSAVGAVTRMRALGRLPKGQQNKTEQAYEDRVLKGGIEILKKASACILEVSLDSLYEGQADFYQLTSFLSEMNYIYAGNLDQIYGQDGRVIFFDALYIKKDAKRERR